MNKSSFLPYWLAIISSPSSPQHFQQEYNNAVLKAVASRIQTDKCLNRGQKSKAAVLHFAPTALCIVCITALSVRHGNGPFICLAPCWFLNSSTGQVHSSTLSIIALHPQEQVLSRNIVGPQQMFIMCFRNPISAIALGQTPHFGRIWTQMCIHE